MCARRFFFLKAISPEDHLIRQHFWWCVRFRFHHEFMDFLYFLVVPECLLFLVGNCQVNLHSHVDQVYTASQLHLATSLRFLVECGS